MGNTPSYFNGMSNFHPKGPSDPRRDKFIDFCKRENIPPIFKDWSRVMYIGDYFGVDIFNLDDKLLSILACLYSDKDYFCSQYDLDRLLCMFLEKYQCTFKLAQIACLVKMIIDGTDHLEIQQYIKNVVEQQLIATSYRAN